MLKSKLTRAARPSWLLLALPATAALMMALGPGPVRGEDELFDFVPAGGRTLLERVIAAGAPQGALDTMTGESRDAQAWLDWIEANRDSVAGLDALDDFESRTLAVYLEHVAPMEAAGRPGDELAQELPRDGRDLTMQYCQSCHIITVTVTQDRTREAWLSTLNNPSHVEIAMDANERSLMAEYLVLNAGIPIDLVPPPLRAGGASY